MARPFKLGARFALLAQAKGAIVPDAHQKNGKPKDWRYWGRRLTKVFNRWIRLRDTVGILGGHARIGKCITCGAVLSFEKLLACHYIPSQHLGTRWHEKNVNAGCAHCNKWMEGNRPAYTENLPKKWGAGVLVELAIAKKLNARHPDIESLKLMWADYTARVKAIEAPK